MKQQHETNIKIIFNDLSLHMKEEKLVTHLNLKKLNYELITSFDPYDEYHNVYEIMVSKTAKSEICRYLKRSEIEYYLNNVFISYKPIKYDPIEYSKMYRIKHRKRLLDYGKRYFRNKKLLKETII
jgi:hypothetical protein